MTRPAESHRGRGRLPSGATAWPSPPYALATSLAADVLALCGDLTDTGEPEDARALVRALSPSSIPTVAVLGNHDCEAGKMPEVSRILCDAGIHVLDGTSFEIYGVGFAGVKGFAGGFGRGALGPWARIIKLFVREALNEALKLETALAAFGRAPDRADAYSPIEGTVAGSPRRSILPGSSRLDEPLTLYPVNAVFHGHAHHGTADADPPPACRSTTSP